MIKNIIILFIIFGFISCNVNKKIHDIPQINLNKKESSKIFNKEKQIEELGYLFKNIEGCNLKKTSTNFVNFYGNIN